jgi:hypothetical protein
MSLAEIFSKKEIGDVKREIVLELLNSDNNLEEKTELGKPLKWSCLKAIQSFIEANDLPKSANILDSFINISFRYLISNSRKGRNEYIEALKSLGNMGEQDQENQNSSLTIERS